jgi:arabinofuranosyltransferase
LLVVIGAGAAWAYFFYFQTPVPPFEDAAILLRYADHLAQGHGLVWNIGEVPVDGATDFLFMLMVAGLARAGMGIENAALALTLAAHLLTVFLVYRLHIIRFQGTIWAASLSALVVATGPGLNYCEALFGTTVFALAGLVTYSHFLKLMEDRGNGESAARFALAGLITCLIRPEGVVLVLGMFMSMMWYLRGALRGQLVARFVVLFILPGIAYFAWHWWYFGHPLPNPFYIKGGGALYPASLKASFIGVVKMGSVLLPIMAWAAWKKDARRKTMLLLAPVVLFAVAWILMSNAMNFSHRFQYILMPVLWVAWAPAVELMHPGFSLRKGWLLVGMPLCALVVGMHYMIYAKQPRIHADGRADLGKALVEWKGKGYAMAVTEAGNLPLYSGWRTLDTWGLNDQYIAHQGVVDAAYLDRYEPALIMIHDYWSPGHPKQRPEAAWGRMTDTLDAYIASRNYALVACWGRLPGSTHFYYLHRDIPDFEGLRALIAPFPYRWYEDGELAENFLQER